MSLKAVHIAFIVCAVALAGVVGFAAVRAGHALAGGAAIAVGAALVVYGVAFLRKMKHVGFV